MVDIFIAFFLCIIVLTIDQILPWQGRVMSAGYLPKIGRPAKVFHRSYGFLRGWRMMFGVVTVAFAWIATLASDPNVWWSVLAMIIATLSIVCFMIRAHLDLKLARQRSIEAGELAG